MFSACCIHHSYTFVEYNTQIRFVQAFQRISDNCVHNVKKGAGSSGMILNIFEHTV